jgi:hypothetical protein
MKSTPKVTDGLAGTGTRVAKGNGTSPVTTLGAGKSGTWAAKTFRKNVPVPAVAGPGLTFLGLVGGVTNTSDTVLPSSSAVGLDGGL